MKDTRIQKAISDAGYTSRRKAEELIAAGKVKVNGHLAEIGMKVDVKKDIITINGEEIRTAAGEKLWYVALNKPRGFVTTTSDEMGRKTVMDLVEDIPARIYPIGRLDRNSEGLIFLTNDGAFANMIMHPSGNIQKTYRVTVRETGIEEKLIKLSEGVKIDSGFVRPVAVTVLEENEERTVLQFTIAEGKNREIRKMCEAVDLTVIRLKRTSIGVVRLGMLQQGKWRELTKDELTGLHNLSRKGISGEQTPKKNSGRKPLEKH
ncbi:MAG: rRNA pseudouridine synthase, partial [Ruminococcaceae bacterium]|nr:rRNA pseudouridine synthase [Oscillospiraceae bacterium]